MSCELWSSLLRESSKRSRNIDSVAIVLGDSDSGKSKLTDCVCASNSNSNADDHEYKAKEIMSYNFLEVDDSNVSSDVSSKVGFWSISEKCFDKALDIVLRPKVDCRVIFLITLDLSQPEHVCLSSLEYWLKKIISFSQQYLEQIGKLNESENELLNYLKSIKHSKLSSTEIAQELVDIHLKINVGFPIVIVGCKSDCIFSQDLTSINTNRSLQGKIRATCLQFGAGLIYTSTQKETNINILRKYILHRLFPDSFKMDLIIEDGLENVFIPSGYDRKELIEISTGFTEWNTIDTINWSFVTADSTHPSHSTTSVVSNTVSSSGRQTPVPDEVSSMAMANTVELEDENEWLTGLQNFIKQAYDLNATSSTSEVTTTATRSFTDVSADNTFSATTMNISTTQTMNTTTNSGTTGTTTTTTTANTNASMNKAKQRLNPANTSNQDVNSFFQSLLGSAPKK